MEKQINTITIHLSSIQIKEMNILKIVSNSDKRKYQNFQGPSKFSRIFQAWISFQFQGLSGIFKARGATDDRYNKGDTYLFNGILFASNFSNFCNDTDVIL